MGWLDDDLHLKRVGEATNYFYGTQAEVRALPITTNGRTEAYAFYSVDAAEDAAGFVYRMGGPFPVTEWYTRLGADFAAGVAAEDAITRLRGTVSQDGVWAVGTDVRHAPSKDALREELNPDLPPASGTRRANPAVGPQHIDAVLRGEMSSTRDIDAAIANLDQAVSARPTPDPLIVAMPRTFESLPAQLEPGTRIAEPTFLRTVLSTRETTFPGADAVLQLRVEAGTPAIFVDSGNDALPGTLLLGRGLTWEITGVVTESTPVTVLGRVVPDGVPSSAGENS